MGFEFIDISGDAGVRAWGETYEEVFVSATEGMFGLMTDLDGVREESSEKISVSSRNREGLLVGWLNELIFRFDAYGFVVKRTEIERLAETELAATVYGEEFDLKRHERRLLVKAATYHNLKFEHTDGLYRVEVIFDI